MENKILSIIFILGGVILFFRKTCIRLILKYQGKSKPNILKFFERKLEQKVSWDVEIKDKAHLLLEISTIVAGIIFFGDRFMFVVWDYEFSTVTFFF